MKAHNPCPTRMENKTIWFLSTVRHTAPHKRYSKLPSLLEAIDDFGSLPDDEAISRAEKIRSGLLEVHKSICKWKSLYEMDATCPWFPNIMTANPHTHTLSFEIICLTEMEKIDCSWLTAEAPPHGLEAKYWRSNTQTKRYGSLLARSVKALSIFFKRR